MSVTYICKALKLEQDNRSVPQSIFETCYI